MMFLYVVYREYTRKIGISSAPKARALSLSGRLEFSIGCPDDEAAHAEQRAHDILESRKFKGEWFFCGKKRAIAAVKEAAEWAAAGNRYPRLRHNSVATSKAFAKGRDARLEEAARLWKLPRRDASKEAIAAKVGIAPVTIAKHLGSREKAQETAHRQWALRRRRSAKWEKARAVAEPLWAADPDSPEWLKGEDIAFKVGFSLRTIQNRLGSREDARDALAEKATRSSKRIQDAE